MKIKSTILFFVLIYTAYSCSSQGDGSVSVVDVNGSKMFVSSFQDIKPDTMIIPLSSLVENCSLVQLQTTKEAFFTPWYTTVTEKYIGVRDHNIGSYKLFARSGKFLYNIGTRGQGPGEYNFPLYDDIIDEKNGLIYIAPFLSDKIQIFNTSGVFLKNIVAPHRLQKAKIFLSDGILSVIHMPTKEQAIAFQFDAKTGQLLNEIAAPENCIITNIEGEIFNTRNVAGINGFYHFGSRDTLYHYDTASNNFHPLFSMEFGSAKVVLKSSFILNEHIIMTRFYRGELDRGFVPGGLIATDTKNMKSFYIKIVNDYYGNITAVTDIRQLRNGYYVYNLQPEDLMDIIDARLAESSCTEKDRQILKKTLSTLKKNTNNVVFIGKLRKELK